jgi:PPOX class probable F420-dependent enzyme
MLDPTTKHLAKGKNFAALTTLFADGRPQTNLMWVDADDEHLLVNTEVHRQKYRNIKRDPRVAIALIDSANPYHYTEVRGSVVAEVRGEAARAHIDELSIKYTGHPYASPIRSERVILKIAAERTRKQIGARTPGTNTV